MSLNPDNQIGGLKLYNNIQLQKTTSINKNLNILYLTNKIIKLILSNIKNTYDYRNIRLVCKAFYYIFENMHLYSPLGKILKKVYIKNHHIYRVEKFNTINFNLNRISHHYLYKIYFIRDNCKHGLEVEYDYKNKIKKRLTYKFGLKNGYCDEYADNRLVKRTQYVENIKQGIQSIYLNNYTILIEKEFLIGMLTRYKKFLKNLVVLNASFKGSSLNGVTIVYYDYDICPAVGLNVKNLLQFKKFCLHGKCMVNQFDRILKLNYDQGSLNGLQTVFPIDRKLRFLGNYKNGQIDGKYCLYNNYKCVEEGEYRNGYFDNYISVFNSNDLSKSYFPLSKGILHGNFIERINFMEMRIGYSYGTFDGKYSFTDISNGETIKLVIYNQNNFSYSKMRFGVEYVTFKKTFKKYLITVYNIVEGIKHSGKVTYEIDNLIEDLN